MRREKLEDIRENGRATNINNVAKLKMFTVYYGWYEGHELGSRVSCDWSHTSTSLALTQCSYGYCLATALHATIYLLPPTFVSAETPYRSILLRTNQIASPLLLSSLCRGLKSPRKNAPRQIRFGARHRDSLYVNCSQKDIPSRHFLRRQRNPLQAKGSSGRRIPLRYGFIWKGWAYGL